MTITLLLDGKGVDVNVNGNKLRARRITGSISDSPEWLLRAKATERHYGFLVFCTDDGMPHLTQTHATLDIAFRHGFNEYHLAESLQVDGPKEFSQYTEQLLSLDWSLDDERLTPPAEKPTRHYRVYCYVPKTDKYSNPEAKVVPRVTFMSNARA